MAIRYHCPQCRQLLSIASRKAGQPTQCPTCGSQHTVPLESEPTRRPPAPGVSRPVPAPEPPVEMLPSARVRGPLDPAGSSGSHLLVGLMPDDRARHWADDDEEEEGLVISGFERKSDEFDLIPLVDCVFLLLVFYMITASYALQKMIEMAAPAADKKGTVQAVQAADDTGQSSLVVQIDAQNRVTIDDRLVPNPADIPDILRGKLNGDQKNVLIIEADPRAYHETVVAVTDAAKDLPFQHVRMAVKSGDED
ncbi:MAG TPA: biopolymer transporter ExbD [Planctomycetaceae bacterium]|nr:biopolymer transporter ExbD [Planctomycetaceae bacterium]